MLLAPMESLDYYVAAPLASWQPRLPNHYLLRCEIVRHGILVPHAAQ